MDKRRITATDILAAGLVLVMLINILWFLNKKPLSENLDIENFQGNVSISLLQSVGVESGDGIYVKDVVTTITGDVNDDDVQKVIEVMKSIQSRKRFSGKGSILIYTTGINTIEIEYRTKDYYQSFILTDRDNIMRSMGEKGITSYTLSDDAFEKLSKVILEYGIVN